MSGGRVNIREGGGQAAAAGVHQKPSVSSKAKSAVTAWQWTSACSSTHLLRHIQLAVGQGQLAQLAPLGLIVCRAGNTQTVLAHQMAMDSAAHADAVPAESPLPTAAAASQ